MPTRILVVEDEPLVGRIARNRLEGEGYQVFEARDGRTGLRQAEEVVPDLIVLDLGLPGIDGFGVLQALKANPTLARIPVLVLTAAFNPETHHRAMSGGAAACLPKTEIGEPFIERVLHLLGQVRKEQRNG